MKIGASAVPRRLGAFEHLFAAYGEDGTMNFTVAACVSGMLAEADVIVALAKVQERHTLLRASLAWDENDAHCFVRSDRPIPVSVHSGSAATWHRLAEDEMNKPLVSGEAPLVRVVVALHADSSILLLTFNHAVVDGLAAMFVLREILVALSGGELSAPISTSRLEDHMGLDVPLFSQEKHLRANFNKGNHDHASVSLSGVAIDSVEIDKDHLRRLYLNAKSRGLTLNSVLTAAHGRALVDLNDRWSSVPLRVMSPIDLKPEFAIPEHVGLSLSIAITPFERDRPAFWEDARRVQAQISKFRARNMGIWMVSDLAKRFLDDASYEATRERVVNHIPFDTIMTNLALQLQFSLEMSSSSGRLMGAPPA